MNGKNQIVELEHCIRESNNQKTMVKEVNFSSGALKSYGLTCLKVNKNDMDYKLASRYKESVKKEKLCQSCIYIKLVAFH